MCQIKVIVFGERLIGYLFDTTEVRIPQCIESKVYVRVVQFDPEQALVFISLPAQQNKVGT